jgi:hypothetical protein
MHIYLQQFFVERCYKIRKHHSQHGYKPTSMNIPRVTSKNSEDRSIDKGEFKSTAINGKYYTNSKIRSVSLNVIIIKTAAATITILF